MEEDTPAKKAWRTIRKASPGKKAAYTKKWRAGGRKAGKKLEDRQWEQGKVELIEQWRLERRETEHCIVCGDCRDYVLQDHHYKRDSDETVKICANCHQIITHKTVKELKEAHEKGSTNAYSIS